MFKKIRGLFLLISVFAAGAVVASCSSSDDNDGDAISLSPESVFFSAEADDQQQSITVTANGEWTIRAEYPEWIIPSKKDNTTLLVNVKANTEASMREGSVVIVSGSATATLTVRQTGTGSPIHVSPSSLTFDARPDAPQQVEVTSAQSWELGDLPAWLDADTEGDIISFEAAENTSFRQRTAEVAVISEEGTAVISITQKGTAGATYSDLDMAGIPGGFISANGKYIGGTHSNTSFIYDTETETTVYLGSGVGSVDFSDISTGAIALYAISNDGLAVGSAAIGSGGDSLPFIYDVKSGKAEAMNLTGLGTPSFGICYDISADGSVVVGLIGKTEIFEDLNYYPVMWQNRQPVVLGHDLDGLGDGDAPQSYFAKWVSADGSRILGHLNTRYADPVACYWDTSDPEKINFILLDNPEFYHTTTYTVDGGQITLPDMFPRPSFLSADGMVMAGDIIDARTSAIKYRPFSYNIETGQYTISDNNDAAACVVTPEGALIYATPAEGQYRNTYFYEGGASVSMGSWFLNNHELVIPAGNYITIRDISADGLSFAGFDMATGAFTVVHITL